MSNVNSATYNALISSLNASAASKKTNKTELTTDSFFQLLAAQLQNQDMSSPMTNSEMMNQMTQIAMMQSMKNFSTAMDDFQQINTISYGTSMMGKEVLVADVDKDGSLKKITGTVTRVDIFSGTPVIYLDNDENTGYPVANVMSVYEEGTLIPDDLGADDSDKNAGDEV